METVTEAARLTGVPARTIRNWIGAGRITSRWHAGRLLVAPMEILALADQRESSGRLPNPPPN